MPSDISPNRDEALAWRTIRDNVRLAQLFIEGVSSEQFAEDQKTFYAVTRCLEIISEAARRLRGPQQEQHPALEWRQIEDSGNVFRHRYQYVAESQVFLTVQDRLPDLLAAADKALSGLA